VKLSSTLISGDPVLRASAFRCAKINLGLGPNGRLIFMAGQAPIYGRQILYFRDPAFRQRAQVAAPATSDRLDAEAG